MSMRLFTAMNTGRESLIAHGTALSSTADNLGNQNTPGYKSTRAEFSSLLAESVGSRYSATQPLGNGVYIEALSTITDQGTVEFTGRDQDVAIEGRGYFIAEVGEDRFYTRAGNFRTDANGNVTTQRGETVLGFTAESPDTLVPLNINTLGGAAQATTAITMFGNIDAESAIAGENPNNNFAPATFIELNAESNFSTNVEVVDSIGGQHDTALHFFKTGQNTWTVGAYVDGAEVTGGTAGTPALIGTTDMQFDENGALVVANTPGILNGAAAWNNGSNPGAFTVDFSGFSQYAVASSLSSITADGTVPGNLIGFNFDKEGNLLGRLDNGEIIEIGQLAIADFANPAGLARAGNNNFIETILSGTVDVGRANSAGNGAIVPGALELANVDPSNEFVSLIRYQKGYQAGSQVVSTMNDLIGQTIQIA